MKKIIIVIFIGVTIETLITWAANPKQSQHTYALIVSGMNKDPKEQKAKDDAITNLCTLLLDNTIVEPNRLSILVARKSSIHKDAKISTADNLKDQIKAFADVIRPSDRFLFYYVGQANVVTDKLRLNLPGMDVTHEQLAGSINEITSSSMLIVLDCPVAGLAIKALTGTNRIVIGACTHEQRYSTQLSKYFILALTDLQSDADSDGKISILEAFTSAAKQLDESYRQQNLLQTETPILEDNADGVPSTQPWRFREDREDGLLASTYFLSRE